MAREIKEIMACSLSLERKDCATSAPIYRNRGVATRESYFNEVLLTVFAYGSRGSGSWVTVSQEG